MTGWLVVPAGGCGWILNRFRVYGRFDNCFGFIDSVTCKMVKEFLFCITK
jgi:hypothetical protein